jgi:hypothetical protein
VRLKQHLCFSCIDEAEGNEFESEMTWLKVPSRNKDIEIVLVLRQVPANEDDR